jgi:endonuclease YncB( thermonuclease family)
MIDMGYGTVNTDDFAPDVDFQDLQVAQDVARNKHVGMWSKAQ